MFYSGPMKPNEQKIPADVLEALEALVVARTKIMKATLLLPKEFSNLSGPLDVAYDKLDDIIAAVRKPYQPTEHTHGPLDAEAK